MSTTRHNRPRLGISKKLRLIAPVGLLIVLLAAVVVWRAQPEGARLVQTKCLRCHWNAPIGDVRRDRNGWENTVRRMERHGLEVSDEERETLIEWLASERGPE